MKLATLALLCALLAACGGGGGGGGEDEQAPDAPAVTHAPVVATVNGLQLQGSK